MVRFPEKTIMTTDVEKRKVLQRDRQKKKKRHFFPISASYIIFDEALSLRTEKSVFSYIKKRAENVALAR